MAERVSNLEDLFVTLSVIESGLFRDPDAASSFASAMRAGLFPEGISISPGTLYRELYSKGRVIFSELEERLRSLLCEENKPREIATTVGVSATATLADLISQHIGVHPGVAIVVSEICLRIGLERFCSADDINLHA